MLSEPEYQAVTLYIRIDVIVLGWFQFGDGLFNPRGALQALLVCEAKATTWCLSRARQHANTGTETSIEIIDQFQSLIG